MCKPHKGSASHSRSGCESLPCCMHLSGLLASGLADSMRSTVSTGDELVCICSFINKCLCCTEGKDIRKITLGSCNAWNLLGDMPLIQRNQSYPKVNPAALQDRVSANHQLSIAWASSHAEVVFKLQAGPCHALAPLCLANWQLQQLTDTVQLLLDKACNAWHRWPTYSASSRKRVEVQPI